MISVSVAFPQARTVTRSLYDALGEKASWKHDVRLDHQAVRDLQFLVDLPGENCCKAIWKPQTLATIHTDASDTGWGAVMNNLVPAQGFFDQGQQALHITAKELLAVLNAVKMFQQELQQIAVRLVTDNMSVRAVINKGVSSSPVLMKIYRDILTDRKSTRLNSSHRT